MKNYFNNDEEFLSAIEERAFSAGYNARLNERMYAEEEKAAEGILDKIKGYGNKAKDYGKDFWEGKNVTKNKWGNRAIAGTSAAAAAAIPTALYLRKKAKKAAEAAEALEEAAEAQREYSAYLADLEERLYSNDEDAVEEAADIVENASPSDKKRLAIAGAIGAGSVAGVGGGIAGASALRKRGYEKARQALTDAVNKSIIKAEGADKLKTEAEKKLNKYGIDYLTDSNLLERGKDYWKKSSKMRKAGIIGAGTGALAVGAAAGVGAKKLIDRKKNND